MSGVTRNGGACPRCKVNTRQVHPSQGFYVYCHPCRLEYKREADALIPADERRNRRLKNMYNITLLQYEVMLEKQDGACAICKITTPTNQWLVFEVDHDHSCCPGPTSCGKCVRGLLCGNCNKGIGRFADNSKHLRSAAAYLDGITDEVYFGEHHVPSSVPEPEGYQELCKRIGAAPCEAAEGADSLF
jgi:hypothetical protein